MVRIRKIKGISSYTGDKMEEMYKSLGGMCKEILFSHTKGWILQAELEYDSSWRKMVLSFVMDVQSKKKKPCRQLQSRINGKGRGITNENKSVFS